MIGSGRASEEQLGHLAEVEAGTARRRLKDPHEVEPVIRPRLRNAAWISHELVRDQRDALVLPGHEDVAIRGPDRRNQLVQLVLEVRLVDHHLESSCQGHQRLDRSAAVVVVANLLGEQPGARGEHRAGRPGSCDEQADQGTGPLPAGWSQRVRIGAAVQEHAPRRSTAELLLGVANDTDRERHLVRPFLRAGLAARTPPHVARQIPADWPDPDQCPAATTWSTRSAIDPQRSA